MSHLDRRSLLRTTAESAALVAASAALIGHAPLSPAVAQTPATGEEDSMQSLVAGNTAFALDLYHQLRANAGGNLLVSPLSISLALAMAFAGARGDTATQMADVLGFDLPDDALHTAFAALVSDLTGRGNAEPAGNVEGGENGLRIANALWGEQTYPFSDVFAAQLGDAYGAGLELVDFANAPEQARADINAWVEEQTEDRIQDIVPEGAITDMARLVLANAIYFYGSWRHAFEPADTENAPFHLADGTTVDVPFMFQRQDLSYARTDGMQLVELPYISEGLAMTVILPDDGRFDAVEESLDDVTLQMALAGLSSNDIRLHLPKFGFDFSASVADALKALGMTDAFDPDLADFSGMVDEGATPPDGENLSIGDVLHKAFIAVDEEGTEAAAATVVIMVGTSAQPEEPIEVRVDRPFLFAIRDRDTGTILFLGRVTNPSS